MNHYDISIVTANNEWVNLRFEYQEVDEDMDEIIFDDDQLMLVYRISPDHPDIKPYYRVEYDDNIVYCANDQELKDYLRSFFYLHKLCPVDKK